MAARHDAKTPKHAAIALEDEALAAVAGGMEVRVGEVSSTVRTTDGGSLLSPDLLGNLVGTVLGGIRDAADRGRRRPQ
ncbi:hypothetical protein [Anaeromyxobacter oryzae]|uniref:Uncharacterized protein n=1 Tax=Anaeromyxobacter oryzae TaxID=2918170 RepID=A0ABM7X1M1_9BACT|nr:hypothetical protein [Anaeromyxobacter oryzae]BDG05678.1 hypothetical protein AMOR_46740 [Anaeromyxobacter oryzae]